MLKFARRNQNIGIIFILNYSFQGKNTFSSYFEEEIT